MADTKTSALTALTGIAPDDLIPVVDVSDTTQGAGGSLKKITREEFQTYDAGTFTTNKKVVDLSVTWNNAAVTFTADKINVTDTASNAASLLIDRQVGGVSKFYVDKSGNTVIGNAGNYFGCGGYGNPNQTWMKGTQLNVIALGIIGFNQDTYLNRDAADTLAQRRGTNAQTFRLYNTFTDASNYERGFMRWASNVLEIGSEAAGTGTVRTIRFRNGSHTLEYGTDGSISFPGMIKNISANAFFEIVEMAGAPSAPPANRVRIYAQDNGAGKTQLMARFATGAAQQLAIEP